MQALAKFIMTGRLQAIMVVVLTAGLSLLLPPLSYLSGGAIALVTLRHGMPQGLQVTVIAALVLAIFGQFGLGSSMPAIVFIAVVWLPAWILAGVLRRTISLSQTITLAYGLGVIAVAALYLLVGDLYEWWYQMLQASLGPVFEQAMIGQQEGISVDALLKEAAKIMTGAIMAGFLLNALCCLLLARWWQACLFNPGGFKNEFHGLRLGKKTAGFASLVIVLTMVSGNEMAANLLVITVMIFILQGMALTHAVVAKKEWHTGVLVAVYVMIFIIPQVMLLFALMGLVDAWVDFRNRLGLINN